MFTSMPRAEPRVIFIDDIFYTATTRASLCAQASDVSLVEEARAYENNCIFAEGAPSPRLGPRVDPRPGHGPPPDAFGLLPLLSLFDTVNALSICGC